MNTSRNEVIERYTPIISAINREVFEFNHYISENHKIPLFDFQALNDDMYFHVMNGKTWDKISFPRHCDEAGVYFYFGYESGYNKKLCLYVGKASMTSFTGARLFQHFKNAFDENGQLYKLSKEGIRYNIEAVLIIPLGRQGTSFLSASLEEFLIQRIKESNELVLLNKRGL